MSFQAQFGMAQETAWGTYVAPDRFLEFLPGESLQRRQTVLTSQGLQKNAMFARGSRRVLTKNDAGGDINFEVATTRFGILFYNMLGAKTVTTPVTGVYDHTFTPGDLSGLSMSMQKGVENVAGSSIPFTYRGVKVVNWEMGVAVDQILNLKLSVDAKSESTGDSLASATYPNFTLFHFGKASLYIDSVLAANVTEATISSDNSLNTERYHLGQLGAKKEPRHNDHRMISGNFNAEFTDLGYYAKFAADTSAVLVMTYLGADITTVGLTTYTETLKITLADVRFEGDTPKVEDPEVGRLSVPFGAWAPVSTSTNAIEIFYRTTDATA